MNPVKPLFLPFLSIFLSACATVDLDRNTQHGVNLESVALTAKAAVEKKLNVSLDDVKWELADEYRLTRLTYKIAHDEYKVMVNHPFYARILADAVSAVSSEHTLGSYKKNIKTVFINPEQLDAAYAYDLKNREIARQIYLALFIHEYIHAADFAKLSDSINSESYYPGQTELLIALLEGHAEYISEQLCEEYDCKDGYDILENGSRLEPENDDSEQSPREKKLSKIYQAEMQFKYAIGKQYIENHYRDHPSTDPIPRELSELPHSPMLVLYPENERLKDNSFSTADELMDGLKSLDAEFSYEDYIYHFNVFTPLRLLAIIKQFTGTNIKLARGKPPYYHAVSLKLFDLSEEIFYDFENYSYFMLLLDMGSESQSHEFLQNVAANWDKETISYSGEVSSPQKRKDLRYVSRDQTMLMQFENFVLLTVSKQEQPDNSLWLNLSKDILSSL